MTRARLLLLALALVLLGASCGRSDQPVELQAPREGIAVEIVGGSDAQRALLEGILEGLRPQRLERVEIAKPDKTFAPLPEDALAVISTPRGSPGDARGTWEGWLVAGVFRDRSAEQGLPPVLAGGSPRDMARIDPPEEVSSAVPRDQVAEGVREAAAASDADLVELEIVQPYGPAPLITLRTAEPAAFLAYRLPRFLTALRAAAPEGFFLNVVDGNGEVVYRIAVSERVHAASGGVLRKELRGCVPAFLPGPESAPPPCPV